MKAYGASKEKATEMVKKKVKSHSFNGKNKGKTTLEQRGRVGARND